MTLTQPAAYVNITGAAQVKIEQTGCYANMPVCNCAMFFSCLSRFLCAVLYEYHEGARFNIDLRITHALHQKSTTIFIHNTISSIIQSSFF